MKNKIIYLIVFIAIALVGCGGSSGKKEPVVKKTSLNGVVQKGPFLQGSVAKIFKLDSQYERTTTMMQTTLSNDRGTYSFDDISWSGVSEIEVKGLFLDENTGVRTKTATVTSVVMVAQDGTVNTNVNVLTHMASGQIKKLLKEGKTLQQANEKVAGEVLNILGRTNLGVDDFGDLDLADIFGSNASANSELLFISAALLKSNDYMADLEALLTLYKEGGIDAILGSDVYARLLQYRADIDETTIAANINPGATEAQLAQIKVKPMAQITKILMRDVISVRLYGTQFNAQTPDITLSTTGGVVAKGEVMVATDKKSATIAISGDVGGCKDVYVSVQVDGSSLTGTANPVTSNTLNMHPSTLICADNVPSLGENLSPVAIIGMLDNSENGQQAAQSITVAVGTVVSGLETYYSYDQDPYPNGGIAHCEWKDENSAVVKSASNNECGIYDKVFNVVGDYTYTLTVTDNRGATNSNTVTIKVAPINPNDTPPTAKIDEQTTSVNQEIYAGHTPHAMAGGSDDKGIVYCKWTDASRKVLAENTITIPVKNLGYSQCPVTFPTLMNAGDYIYTLTIRDTAGQEDTNELNVKVLPNGVPTATIGENRNIVAGTTLNITAVAYDADGDAMTYQWMYGVKGSGSMNGAGSSIDFSHQFNDVGLYVISFRVSDTHNTNSVVEVEVNVTAPTLDVVIVEDLMWEDTLHARTNTVSSWSSAQTYCDTFTLGGFDNWRLATANELRSIMAGVFSDNTKSAIMEGFVQILPNENVTSWTSDNAGVKAHLVGWFTGGDNNLDGLGNDESGVGIRCVR